MIEKALGRHIMSLRKQMGLTQDELAQRIGIHVSTLSAIETGKRNMSILNIQKIADGLGISLSELFETL